MGWRQWQIGTVDVCVCKWWLGVGVKGMGVLLGFETLWWDHEFHLWMKGLAPNDNYMCGWHHYASSAVFGLCDVPYRKCEKKWNPHKKDHVNCICVQTVYTRALVHFYPNYWPGTKQIWNSLKNTRKKGEIYKINYFITFVSQSGGEVWIIEWMFIFSPLNV